MKNWMVYATGVFFFLLIGALFIFLITRDGKPENKPAQPSSGQQAPKPDKLKQAQTDGTTVRYTTHSQVVGEERYRGIRITVSPDERTIDLLQGYDNQVIKTLTLPNSRAAYDTFVAAIDGAGFDQTQEYPQDVHEDSICPLGQHYSYEILAGSMDKAQDTWSTSCSNKDGNFGGKADLVRTLFRKQIPDYEKFVAKFAL